ncbi:N-formylglutamate deformylase [Ovoidimarina sediminis]|uniref:N-formylglutamate deformylase n=1 Tax=Ovoidimarina sediminis TaxID=3079856 RepID=UPI002908C0A3|nr:N-formylglutamate deformylase [Rhodophyticola sp. MJ-SS7]MDU8944251.1 N-formylglutamate deformylase [Rhodophyticola sp. MJ-SS7]
MSFLDITRGDSPLVLGLPHTGTDLPPQIYDALNDTGRALADTDWHIHQLYDGLFPGATTVRTAIHRYAIDVNRDPSGESLYPGQNTTGLCPLIDFDGNPIYRSGQEPSAEDIIHRRETWHDPYHAALEAELARIRDRYGFAILYDCHSIRSGIPFLFDGRLPDFNIGTNEGRTCDPSIESAVTEICASAVGYTAILNGRFKGGWTTRHYGRPREGIHAIQMELAQSAYLTDEAPPWRYDPGKAARLRNTLATILNTLLRWRPT